MIDRTYFVHRAAVADGEEIVDLGATGAGHGLELSLLVCSLVVQPILLLSDVAGVQLEGSVADVLGIPLMLTVHAVGFAEGADVVRHAVCRRPALRLHDLRQALADGQFVDGRCAITPLMICRREAITF